jgi:molybdopterin molybdotransferase
MISVEEALGRVTAAFSAVAAEKVALADALGRVLAEDLRALLTQPPVAVSAMDGYAVRASDVTEVPATLRQVGEAPAGGAYAGRLKPGEAVRIFTGGPVPDGADAIVIQERTNADGDRITVLERPEPGRFIRPAGLDFDKGRVCLTKGRRLSPRDIGLAAAMGAAELPVRRRPRIAVLATGDELVPPGTTPGPNRIVSSNGPALVAFVAATGGTPIDLGIAGDSIPALQAAAKGAGDADLLVMTGGVSVGDHDLAKQALTEIGFVTDFWQVAMRPGKPLLFGRLGRLPVLGFPGNPVSALVCAVVYLGPAIAAMLGEAPHVSPPQTALLASDLPVNDHRQDYLRAKLSIDAQGNAIASPFTRQDSAMLSFLADADCLVVRPPLAPAAKAGARVPIILLSPLRAL